MVLHEQLENARMAAEASQRNSKAAQNACNNETSDTKASQPKKVNLLKDFLISNLKDRVVFFILLLC